MDREDIAQVSTENHIKLGRELRRRQCCLGRTDNRLKWKAEILKELKIAKIVVMAQIIVETVRYLKFRTR